MGATSDGKGEIDIGVAAHICAASPKGPRFDSSMTREQRSSADNGLWLCTDHSKVVDSHDPEYTVERLHEWKAQAQRESWQRVIHGVVSARSSARTLSAEDLRQRIRAAARADLDAFSRSDKWPRTSVELTLQVDGIDSPVSTHALATALTTVDNLIVVAPPGSGKTTTLFQIAEAALAPGNALPIVILLSEWSTGTATLLGTALTRQAFRNILEDDLRAVAAHPGVILMLDGWNELDGKARRRAIAEIDVLTRELPELSFLVSTRKQALDVPIEGQRVSILQLNERQQSTIAKTLRGDAGSRLLDTARRTAGLQELVGAPLYLTALLDFLPGAQFPSTKEEVLRGFVAAHEDESLRVEAVASATQGFQQRYLDELAKTAISSGNTAIEAAAARRAVSRTAEALRAEGQIATAPEPNDVLEALVSHHVLVRAGDAFVFRHQQFQEWYGSNTVQQMMVAAVADLETSEALKSEVLDEPAWEEAVLFACERMSRGTKVEQEACSAAITSAFAVDPMFAAEMIFRSTESVWLSSAATILPLVEAWRARGKVDRALRFMIATGRREFAPHVWPLITHPNSQVRLAALRAIRPFRPSVLGPDAENRLAALPLEVRIDVLYELAFSASDAQGLDFVARVAAADPEPRVKAAVVDAFAFRQDESHLVELLRGADEKTFDLVTSEGLPIESLDDEEINRQLAAARKRWQVAPSAYARLRAILSDGSNADRSDEVTQIVSTMELGWTHSTHELTRHYHRAVADGLVKRAHSGLSLPVDAPDIVSSAEFAIEDDALLELALGENTDNVRAAVAVAALGPHGVGRMIDEMFGCPKTPIDANDGYIGEADARYRKIQSRLARTQARTLVTAIRARPVREDEIGPLADLILMSFDRRYGNGRRADSAVGGWMAELVDDWAGRLLASSTADRSQLSSIASVAGRVPVGSMLGVLERLLAEDLRLRQVERATAEAQGRRVDGVSYRLSYQRAFAAIGGDALAGIMVRFLLDEEFGESAASVLASQWRVANEPLRERRRPFGSGPDFSRVAARRAAREADPSLSSTEGEVIFAAIEELVAPSATDDAKRLALALASVGGSLPHGRREETHRELLAMANLDQRCLLLTAFILSGDLVEVGMIEAGIGELLEEAKTHTWMLSDNEYQLGKWLRMLPFSDQPAKAFEYICSLPERLREPRRLEDVIAALGVAPGAAAESVLFDLARADPRLYRERAWLEAIRIRGTVSSAERLVDLAAEGTLIGSDNEQRELSSCIADLIGEHAQLRARVYRILQRCPNSAGLSVLARAIAENPDTDGVLLLVQLELDGKTRLSARHTIKKVVTKNVSHETWNGAYSVVSVPAIELRRRLLAMTTDGSALDAASSCLNAVDRCRDSLGVPEAEPRHPDLSSGRRWPFMMPDPDATETD